MRAVMRRVVVAAAFVCATCVMLQAQQTSTSSETKSFEVLAVDGSQLIVKLPEGTRELTVPDDFRFTVNGQPLSVRELKPGMKGTATITTRTTVTPVTVTEVKNGTVVQRAGSSITVRTDEGFKMFSQGEVDKRGVKIVKDGKPVELSELREGDRLTARIVTSKPPRVLTQKEVQATVPMAGASSAGASTAAAPQRAAAPAAAAASQAAPAPTGTTATEPAPSRPARTLPKTASSQPLMTLLSVLSLAMGIALTIRRRLAN